jgi:hypothetical protein
MDRVEDGFLDGMRRRHVVRDARGGDELRRVFHGLQRTITVSSENMLYCIAWRTSQTPRSLTRMLLGKRVASICETMKMFDVNADSNMMGICDV